jgi:hypothetical protein
MTKAQAIQPGYCVAVHLTPETAPDCCYLGMVEAVDEHGILINLVHWDDELDMLGGYTESLFVPWANINSMLISTDRQPTRRFMVDTARKWKYQLETMHDKEETVVKKRTSSR